MVSMACGTERARELLAPYGNRVSIAVVNGRSAVVVSGEAAALDELVGHCADLDLRTRRIDVDYASHSVQVEAIRGELAEALAGIEPRSTRIAFFSTVTGSRWTPPDWMPTTGIATSGRPCSSTRRCAARASTATGRSSSPVRIRRWSPASRTPSTTAVGTDTEAIVVPTLGRDDGGLDRFLTSAATRSSRE